MSHRSSNLLVGWLWYRHAAGVSEQTGLTVGLTDKLFAWDLALSSPGFYRVVLRGLALDVLGPLAILLLVVGLVWTTRQGLWAERLAIAGFGAYVLIVARGVFVHDDYLIPVNQKSPCCSGTGPEGDCKNWGHFAARTPVDGSAGARA